MEFKVGDRVDFLNETGGGMITRILDDGRIMVEGEGGFEFPYSRTELLKHDPSLDPLRSDDEVEFDRIRLEDEVDMQGDPSPKGGRRPDERTLEVDLHIEEIVDDVRNLSNTEIVRLQVSHCERFLQKALKERIPRVVLIHGVGEGVLREEIRNLLTRYPNMDYFDAPYKEYGWGATEVRIYKLHG